MASKAQVEYVLALLEQNDFPTDIMDASFTDLGAIESEWSGRRVRTWLGERTHAQISMLVRMLPPGPRTTKAKPKMRIEEALNILHAECEKSCSAMDGRCGGVAEWQLQDDLGGETLYFCDDHQPVKTRVAEHVSLYSLGIAFAVIKPVVLAYKTASTYFRKQLAEDETRNRIAQEFMRKLRPKND